MSIGLNSVGSFSIASPPIDALGTITSSGAITELSDVVAGISKVLVSSSGAITELSDVAKGVTSKGGASLIFKLISNFFH